MSDEPAPIVQKREILHLPHKAKLNGTGVIRRPSGEVRMDDVIEEARNPPQPDEERK